MAGEIECTKCIAKNKPGAILCENCGEPLEVSVGTPTPPSASVAKAGPSGIEGRACALVEGKVTDKEFELPVDDFEFAVGRPDLGEGIIPDVDLTKFVPKVTIGSETGYTVSRKQAVVSRRMGELYLKALGRTMVRLAGEDWKEVKKDEEVELRLGSRFRFGGSEGYAIFEVV